jgi:fumarate hydratase, class II
MQGQFELNVRVPLIARNVLQSIHLLATASTALAEKVVDGVAVNKEGTERSAAATLAVATALNEHIGYDKATTIVQKAAKSGRMLRDVALEEGVDAELYDRVIDLRRIAAGSQADARADGKPARARRSSSRSSSGSSNGGTRRRRGQRASA